MERVRAIGEAGPARRRARELQLSADSTASDPELQKNARSSYGV
jgi:hypothetical protein